MCNKILGYCERPEELAILISVSRLPLRMCGIYLSNIILAFAKNYACLQLLALFTSYSPLLGCAGDWVKMVVKCIVGLFWGTHFCIAANLSPKTVPQCTFTTISTRSPSQPQSVESDRAHFELSSHETFARLSVGAIAFETISPLIHNLWLLLVIVLLVRVIIFTVFILFRWNACWSTRGDAFLFRHARCPCCSCPLKEALYSEEVLLKFKSRALSSSKLTINYIVQGEITFLA